MRHRGGGAASGFDDGDSPRDAINQNHEDNEIGEIWTKSKPVNGATRELRRRAPLEESWARLWFPSRPGLSGRGDVHEASASESDEDNERVDAVEEETDDDENAFFDTHDFLSLSSFRNNGSDLRISLVSSEDEEIHTIESEDEIDPSIKSVGANFPHLKRRKKLPDPIEKEKGVSLWAMIKDNIGKDLTKVCLPVYFNEPLSSLQKCFEDLEYSYLLDRANEWGKRGNSIMRIINVARILSCLDMLPLKEESTYEADYPDKGIRFFSEK
ncbi:Oxysterol-binding protein- protein 1C, partial [Dionaea muscipula]